MCWDSIRERQQRSGWQVPRIPAATVVTEKEGMVCFLDRELMVDYTVAFTSDEPSLLKWCEDLVDSLWKEGVPLQ